MNVKQTLLLEIIRNKHFPDECDIFYIEDKL